LQTKTNSLTIKNQSPANSRQAGFAVLIALTLLSFVLLILLSLTSTTAVEFKNADIVNQQLLARQNARLGLFVALGDLQKYTGPDQKVTAQAEIESATSPSARNWTGVWDSSLSTSNKPGVTKWLVSGENPSATIGADGSDSATLTSDRTDSEPVRADWVVIEALNTTRSKYAYWVSEESVKARVNLKDNSELMTYLSTNEERQNVREQLLLAPDQNQILGEPSDSPLDSIILENLARVQTPLQIGLAYTKTQDITSLLAERLNDFTTSSVGVMENSLSGGLKQNLTGRNQTQIDDLLDTPGNEADGYLKGDYLLYFNINPQTGKPLANDVSANNPSFTGGGFTSNDELVRIPKEDFYSFRDKNTDLLDNAAEVVRNVMPIITEASFRLGAFHAISDEKNRIRFHADLELWNPYPYPIRFPNNGNERAFYLMLVPSDFGSGRGRDKPEKLILSVEKTSAGRGRDVPTVDAEIHTDLTNFDERLDSGFDNWLNETVMISRIEVEDLVLQPGEIYHASTTKSDGLARIQGGYVAGVNPDSSEDSSEDYTEDPSGNYRNWDNIGNEDDDDRIDNPNIAVDDTVKLSLRMPPNGLTFRVIAYDPEGDEPSSKQSAVSPVYEEDAIEWAVPLFELRHIYKMEANPQPRTLNIAEYSVPRSGDYSIDNFNIAFHFKLDDERILAGDLDASNLSLGFDLRQPVWDYDNPAVQNAIMVGGVPPEDALAGVVPDPLTAAFRKDLFFNDVDLFADTRSDSHINYLQVILYPNMTKEPLSVGSFQHLPLSPEEVDYDIDGDGVDEVVQLKVGMPWGGALNEAFDKYFFTGAPSSGWSTTDPLPLPAILREDIDSDRMLEADASGDFMIEGSFNVNSLSKRAWAAMISRTLLSWKYSDSSVETDVYNAFLNLSDSTDQAVKAFGSIINDTDLTSFDGGDLNAPNSAGRQAMRYPLRRLENTQIFDPSTESNDSLVEYLIDEIQEYQNSEGAFFSVSEFVNSGVLHRAIERSDINGQAPRFSTAYITQASILEPIAPYLTVRSDTFTIRSIGQVESSITGRVLSQVILEAVVQRIPDRYDGDVSGIMGLSTDNGNDFGRKFVIKSMSWKNSLL